MERALDDLEMRLALIPEHEKEEYIEALEKCPGLVLTESDPIRFLRFTNFNAPAAAISLTRYWKARKEAFGREKAFLPLALTPNSALDEYVLDWIRSGVSLTPLKDSFGRTLVIFDTTRRINISRDRSSYLFYLHQHAMENDLSQTDGYVMIIIVGDDFEVSSTHHDTVLKFMNIFPIRIKAWHCVRRDGNVSMNAMQAFLVKTYYKIFRGHAVHFHNEASGQAPVDSLACYGISKSVLPRSLGGDWRYWKVHEWIQEKQRTDGQRARTTVPVCTPGAALFGTQIHLDHHRLPLKKRMKVAGVLHATSESSSFSSEVILSKSRLALTSIQENALRKGLMDWKSTLSTACNFPVADSCDNGLLSFLCRHINHGLQRYPEHETLAFQKASTGAPNVVWMEESNPFLFTLCEDFNVVATAKRLLRYWNLRSDTFGANEFKALHQTGEGALERSTDVAVLDTMFVSLLPHDKQDCSVVFINMDRLANYCLTESHKRCLFYTFSVTTENRKSQDDGVTVMLSLTKSLSDELLHSIYDFVGKLMFCLPIRSKAIYILSFDAHKMGGHIFSKSFHNVRHMFSSSKESLISQLEVLGYTREGLPKCIGGDWDYNRFNLWRELRMRVEWNVPLGLSARTCHGLPGIGISTIIENKQERNRRLNVIHSWRKRTRYRTEKADLEERCAALGDEHQRLATENALLESLLSSACAVAARIVRSTDSESDR